ncbi:MAG: hypothetical protein ACYTGJ_09250 [Planctomycetota bacterium]|jgi:hypothetical protein
MTHRTQIFAACHIRSILAILALLIAPLALVGCQSTGELWAPSVTQEHQPDDIPVPRQFTYDEQASWAYLEFQNARMPMRSLELVYWGERPVNELVEWYREQMPIHGWSLESEEQVGERRLVFSKDTESAEILLKRTPDENGRYYVTRLVTRVGVR